ncbi:transposase [Enterococcus rivorum]|uniref:Transposase n=1 Tax=Enterococcus rivorum TaxID=762845 RepID=A0A1E5KW96_9ENTE|nr:transposase [Enterococcus rivorum]OEH82153.1 transposase [Enterococcus rivorum]
MSRRSFDKAFKIAAVKLVIEESFSVREVSDQLSVYANSLYRWVQEYEKYEDNAFPDKGSALFGSLSTRTDELN